MNEIQITTNFFRKKEEIKKNKKKFFVAGVIFSSVLLFLFYQVRAIILTPVIAQPYNHEAPTEIKSASVIKPEVNASQESIQQIGWLKLITAQTIAYFFDNEIISDSVLWIINDKGNRSEITSFSPKNQSWVVNTTYFCDEGVFKGYEFINNSLRTIWMRDNKLQTRNFPRFNNVSNFNSTEIDTQEIPKITETRKDIKSQFRKSRFEEKEDSQPKTYLDSKK